MLEPTQSIAGHYRRIPVLAHLNPSRNQRTALPESFGKLGTLQSLDLSYNQLTTLPETFNLLVAVEHLDVWFNQITALPGCFHEAEASAASRTTKTPSSLLSEPYPEVEMWNGKEYFLFCRFHPRLHSAKASRLLWLRESRQGALCDFCFEPLQPNAWVARCRICNCQKTICERCQTVQRSGRPT